MTPYSLRSQVLRTGTALLVGAVRIAVFMCPTLTSAGDEWKCVDVQQCQTRFVEKAPHPRDNCKLISGLQLVEEPAPRIFEFEGREYSFPWDTCDKEALAFIGSMHPSPKSRATTTGGGASFPTGSLSSSTTSEPAAPTDQHESSQRNVNAQNKAQMVGSLIGGIVGIVLGSMIGAILVRAATAAVAKFAPPFGMAYRAVLVGGVVSYLAGYTLVVIFGGGYVSHEGYMILVVIGFVIQALALNLLVRDTTGARLSLAKSALVGVFATLTFILMVAGVASIVVALN